MSLTNIRSALEGAIDGMLPALQSVHQGEGYAPVIGTPYQAIYLLKATPENPTLGDGYYVEQGVLQITLNYPAGEGTAASTSRAEAIRDLLRRGATFSYGGTVVQIDRTPAVTDGEPDEGFIAVIVRAPWHADIYT